MAEALNGELKRLSEKSKLGDELIFHARNDTPFSDTNLLHQHLMSVPSCRRLSRSTIEREINRT
jgi:hypothetical protein